MSLLCVKVKKGKLNGPPDKFNTYVILKVQNLKSTTITRRGNEPCWEQDYMFEINDMQRGLIVEVWDKRLLWDSLLGSVWIPLTSVGPAAQEGPGAWWPLNTDVLMEGSEICGVENPTLHEILLDVYYELPAEIPEDEAHFLVQRLKTFGTDEDTHWGSKERLNITKSTSNQMGYIEDSISLCSSCKIACEDQNREYHSAHSTAVQNWQTALSNLQHSPVFHSETPILKHSSTISNNRKPDDVKLAPNHRNDVESCSTCSLTPSSQLSLENRLLLGLTDSCSLESRACSSATLSQVTPEASFSEASESYSTHSNVADLGHLSQTTSYSLLPLSPEPQSDHEESTCCSRSSSSCSCTSKDPVKFNGEEEVAYGNGVSKEVKKSVSEQGPSWSE